MAECALTRTGVTSLNSEDWTSNSSSGNISIYVSDIFKQNEEMKKDIIRTEIIAR
jgi:hypothetical protein